MNGTTWESSKNGLRMLEAVAERLSPRKWTLLACQMLRQFHASNIEPHLPTIEFVEHDADGFKTTGATTSSTPNQAGERQLKIVEHLDPRSSDDNNRWLKEHQGKLPTAILLYYTSVEAQDSIDSAEQCCEQLLEAITNTVLLLAEASMQSFASCFETFQSFGESLRNAEFSRLEVAHTTRLALRYSARAEELQQQLNGRNARLIRANAEDYIDSTELKFYGLEERTRRNVTRWYQKVLASSLREQLGNPYRKNTIADDWRTETVLALARGIVTERAFDRLPILADALEEAGCQDHALLNHARSNPHHSAGCWVVDRLLHPAEPVFQQSLRAERRPLGRSEQMGRYTSPPEGMA
jgi:hypothetical protein